MPETDRGSLGNVLLVPALLAIPCLIAICVKYVALEQPGYAWDFSGYWFAFHDYGALISSGSGQWLAQLMAAIRVQDYSPAPVIPLYPFYWLSGGGRGSYIVAIALLYLLPAALVATGLAMRVLPQGRSRATAPLVFLMAVTYVPFWVPTLRGMVDIAGLVFFGLAAVVLFQSEFLTRRRLVAGLALGVLLWLPFLMRRWYAFSIVAFFAAAYGFSAFLHWRGSRRVVASLARPAVPLLIAGLVLASLALAFQHDLVLRAATTSYADLYSAYQVPFLQHFTAAGARLGIFLCVMIALGVLVALWTQNARALFCLVVAAITFGLFIRTQQVGIHHFLPIAFLLFPSYALAADWLAERVAPRAPLALAPFAALSAVIFLVALFPVANKARSPWSLLVPQDDTRPIVVKNYEEYQRLVADLDRLMGKDDKLVVFASSMNLSDSLLTVLDPRLRGKMSYAAHIAKVDRFNLDNLRADYALAADPPQTHMPPETQVNITLPSRWLLEKKGFGAAYERVGEGYRLANGTTATVFRRTRPVTAAEAAELIDALGKTYADWPALFRRSMKIPLMGRQEQVGDVYGLVAMVGPERVLLHPGATTPTSLTVMKDARISDPPSKVVLSIDPKLLIACPRADGVDARMTIAGKEIWTGTVLPGQPREVALPADEGPFTITVDKRAEPSCDHLTAAFVFP